MIRSLSSVLVLLAMPIWSSPSLVWDQASSWPDVRLSPEMRRGAEQLVLKSYGSMIERYDKNSKPAIGFREIEVSGGTYDRLRVNKVHSVPAGFSHDPETGEIYVAMLGGGGLTVLNPRAKTSVTYRNDGIWDTSESAEGILLRDDWKFSNSTWRSEEKPTLFQALRRQGTHDLFVSNDEAFLYLIHRHDPDTYEDEELQRDFWKLGFMYEGQPDLFQDEQDLLYLGGAHGEGFHILHPDLRTVTRYNSREGVMLIRDGKIIEQYNTPKLPGYGKTRVLFKGRNGDLYVGGYGHDDRTDLTWIPDRLQTEGNGLVVLKNFDMETQRYTMSLNYRTTGLWNTTDQVGLRLIALRVGSSDEELTTDNLISRTPQLPGGAVYHGWEDEEGRVYLGTSGGLVFLYPDGHLEKPAAFQGRAVFYTFRSSAGDLYLNTSEGIEVWYADGTLGSIRSEPGVYPPFPPVGYTIRYGEKLPLWLDREGHFNAAIQGEGVETYGLVRTGTATGPPVDLSALQAPWLRWEAGSATGTSVRLQVRTGDEGDGSSSTWSPWRDLANPQGSPLVPSDASHRWVQWRAVFERQDQGQATAPALRGVWIEESTPTAVEEVETLPQQTALYANYPNPFNAETTIAYQLSQTALVQLTINNMAGQRVRNLEYSTHNAGVYKVSWDGKDDEGTPMGSGVYLVRLIAGDYGQTRRILLLK